ncbi:hypothetical protein BD408DRAFT_408719, partial [Parasitella parasitica]
MYNSIQFPPSTISSKLSSKLLKKPPSPIDWMHQSYMELIQDISYNTTHYYEIKENGSSILEASAPESRKNATQQQETLYSDSSMNNQRSSHTATTDGTATPQPSLPKLFGPKSTFLPPSSSEYQKDKLRQVQEEAQETTTDDDEDNEFNTITTSSTDCNRSNNLYRLYKEQQSIARPIDELENEDSAILSVATPHTSNYSSAFPSQKANLSVYAVSSPRPDHKIKLVNHQPQQMPKKKLKIIGKLITKMRITAEKPFWSI